MMDLNAVTADATLAYCHPLVKGLLASSLTKRQHLHVRLGMRINGGSGFVTVAESAYGDRDQWEHPYDEITLDKGTKTAKHGMTSRQLHLMHPEFLDEEDGEFWGSAMRGVIIAAVSGVEPQIDEAIAEAEVSIAFAMAQLEAIKRKQATQPVAPYCMICGVQMMRAGSYHACPSCGQTQSIE